MISEIDYNKRKKDKSMNPSTPQREGSTSVSQRVNTKNERERKRQTSDFDICLVWGVSPRIYKEKYIKSRSGGGGGDVFLILHHVSSMSHIFHLKVYLFVFKFSIWYKE